MLKKGQYIKQEDGTYKCKFCCSTILAYNVPIELDSRLPRDMDPTVGHPEIFRGQDESKIFGKVAYCPKCEERPGSSRTKCF